MVKVLRDDQRAIHRPIRPTPTALVTPRWRGARTAIDVSNPARGEVYANIGRILDHCWKRGVSYSLSFETYNIGGSGTPASFLEQHPEAIAINALGEKARDHECTVSDGKLIPSVYHPA